MAKKNVITLTVGDWSRDGHNISESIVIETTFTTKQVESAYKKGTKKVGVDLVEDVCSGYEEFSIPGDVAKKLAAAGLLKKLKWSFDENEDEELEGFGADGWVELYLAICQLGNPKLKFKYVQNVRNVIHTGGYGLFAQ